jgi:type I restriction-modification system DNA methylase subunit
VGFGVRFGVLEVLKMHKNFSFTPIFWRKNHPILLYVLHINRKLRLSTTFWSIILLKSSPFSHKKCVKIFFYPDFLTQKSHNSIIFLYDNWTFRLSIVFWSIKHSRNHLLFNPRNQFPYNPQISTNSHQLVGFRPELVWRCCHLPISLINSC